MSDILGTIIVPPSNNEWKSRIEAATVSLPTKGGQGVLIPGGFIVTAAHCVDWNADGGMALGDSCLEVVKPKTGSTFRMSVYAVEPVADIAVLGPADSQELSSDADAFDNFCGRTTPVPVSSDDFEVDVPVRVHVLTHRNRWIAAAATRDGDPESIAASVCVESEENIEGGTSGGPIVNDAGSLVGIVSWAGGAVDEPQIGTMPRPHLALSRWVWHRIRAASVET